MTCLVDAILKGISDGRRIGDRRGGKSPLGDLIIEYNNIAGLANFAFPLIEVTDDTNGADFKEVLKQLPALDQLRLLDTYAKSVVSIDEPYQYQVEDEDEKETRHLRTWIIKFTVKMAGVLLISLVGGAIALVLVNDDNRSTYGEAYIRGVFEIIKFMVSIGTGTPTGQ